MDTKKLGDLGEKIAADFLKKKGYKILEKNYIPRWLTGKERKEIDIIAKKNDVICFVEVKTLSGGGQTFLPEDKVDFIKQRKIIKTAESYLLETRISPETKWQIDVVAINLDLNLKKAKIYHLKNVIY